MDTRGQRSLYDNLDELDMEPKKTILDLLDDNYAKLKMFSNQIEVRRIKRELGLTENIAFYDIYASLGQYRKAMTDYMTEEKKELKDDDFFNKIKNSKIPVLLLINKKFSSNQLIILWSNLVLDCSS